MSDTSCGISDLFLFFNTFIVVGEYSRLPQHSLPCRLSCGDRMPVLSLAASTITLTILSA